MNLKKQSLNLYFFDVSCGCLVPGSSRQIRHTVVAINNMRHLQSLNRLIIANG